MTPADKLERSVNVGEGAQGDILVDSTNAKITNVRSLHGPLRVAACFDLIAHMSCIGDMYSDCGAKHLFFRTHAHHLDLFCLSVIASNSSLPF